MKSRTVCGRCRKAAITCYCEAIQSFRSTPQFVILLHPRESRKAINTGRMAFLHLQNALLLVGTDFSEDQRLHQLLFACDEPIDDFFGIQWRSFR